MNDSTSIEISLKFKEFINSFKLDPLEVSIYTANYLAENGIKANGSKYGTANIPLFDKEY